MATIQLSSIINGDFHVTVSAQGRLSDQEIAQCICNASIGALSTRQLLEHFRLFQADKPHMSYQSWALERGLWGTWTTKAGKVKPVGANERRAALIQSGESDSPELRVLRQYDAIRAMLAADKETAARIHKMEQTAEKPAEKPADKEADKEAINVNPLLPVLDGLVSVQSAAIGRLNQLITQCSFDDSSAWIADELKAIVASLKAGN